MGTFTISMAIFNSYVSLPEGNVYKLPKCKWNYLKMWDDLGFHCLNCWNMWISTKNEEHGWKLVAIGAVMRDFIKENDKIQWATGIEPVKSDPKNHKESDFTLQNRNFTNEIHIMEMGVSEHRAQSWCLRKSFSVDLGVTGLGEIGYLKLGSLSLFHFTVFKIAQLSDFGPLWSNSSIQFRSISSWGWASGLSLSSKNL